jgi:hypothetical protein
VLVDPPVVVEGPVLDVELVGLVLVLADAVLPADVEPPDVDAPP